MRTELEADVSNCTEDVRTKIPPDEYRLLTALAIGNGDEIHEYARRVLLTHLANERRRHRLVDDALKGEGGVTHVGSGEARR